MKQMVYSSTVTCKLRLLHELKQRCVWSDQKHQQFEGSPVQFVSAEREGSVSWALQQKLRWWRLQHCAADWLNAALQLPATVPVPVVAIIAAGLVLT